MIFGIIAAGKGERLVQEGVPVAKPLVKVAGKTLLGRHLGLFEKCGARDIYIVVNANMRDVAEYLNDISSSMHSRLWIKEINTPSSMHSFHELMKMMPKGDRFIVTTVDAVVREEDLRAYLDFFENMPPGDDGVMAVTPFVDDEKPLYVKVDACERITAFEDNASDCDNLVSGGIYGLTSRALPILQTCIDRGMGRMRNFQRELLKAGLNLRAFVIPKIIDVDHITDIAEAEAFIADGRL